MSGEVDSGAHVFARLGTRTQRAMSSGRTRRPAVIAVTVFAVAIAIGTGLLMLPVARAGPDSAPFSTAVFTSTSSVCVVGLSTVDFATYWSTFGHVVVAVLVQIGGFGITTLASLFALVVYRRMGLRSRLMAQQETQTLDLGDVRRVLIGVGLITVTVEFITALLLTIRLTTAYDNPIGEAAWSGLFTSITAYNHQGYALYSDNLVGFVGDWWFCLSVMFAVVVASLGFPAAFELIREWRSPRTWTMHTRIVVAMTATLIVGGTAAYVLFEWTNQRTLGDLSGPTKILAAGFTSVSARTAGFNTIDIGGLTEESLLATNVLMFIGGGPAGPAGGVKVTTFAILGFVIMAQIRGDPEVHLGLRRIATPAIRLAITVALLYVGVLVGGTLLILAFTPADVTLSEALFEAGSALATVGLSTGITNELNSSAEAVVIAMMFIGRLGPVTIVSALALRERAVRYRLPEERPIIG
ncbi:MAG: potassium transporter TrkG [Candidatus Nanopelagicales bacterium]